MERPLYENMTSSTKPEVHNVSQRRQGRTELRSHRQDAKIVRVVSEIQYVKQTPLGGVDPPDFR